MNFKSINERVEYIRELAKGNVDAALREEYDLMVLVLEEIKDNPYRSKALANVTLSRLMFNKS